MYSLVDYDAMFADPVRSHAYLGALSHTIRPDDVVVEIGAGTGYFSVAAVRAGARHVYAIEMDRVADVAREVIRDNGVADRVTVLYGDSTLLSLPERGTVLLDDLRGVLPFFETRAAVIRDAWARHLTPDARSICLYDDLWAAPVVALPRTADYVLDELTAYGIDRSSVARRLRSQWRRVRAKVEQCLAEPAKLLRMTLDGSLEANADATVEFAVEQAGSCDGVIVWFDATFAGGHGIPNAPSAPQALYGQAFFPLAQPVAVRAGDRITLRWRAILSGATYLYAWDTDIAFADGSPSVSYRQSTLADALPARAELEKVRTRPDALRPAPGGAGPHP